MGAGEADVADARDAAGGRIGVDVFIGVWLDEIGISEAGVVVALELDGGVTGM